VPERSKVFIRRCGYGGAGPVVAELLALSGIGFAGRKVLCKPNIITGKEPGSAATTHPAIISAVVGHLLSAGADVTVGDNPGVSGYGASNAAAKKTGIQAASMGRWRNISLEFRRVETGGVSPHGFNVSTAVLDTELLINLPKLKTHSLTTYTGAVKNMFGVLVGSDKAMTHASAVTVGRFSSALVDVFSIRPPDLSIMDAVLAMEGNGPTSGTPRAVGLMGMSTDPVALDAVFARLIGLDPRRIDHLRIAADRGFGRLGAGEIEVDGALPEIKRFTLPLSRRSDTIGWLGTSLVNGLVFPFISRKAGLRLKRDKCTKCGICLRACPTGAMKPGKDGFPEIGKPACISCYCCHELCAEGAWKMSGVMSIVNRSG
jgi:uncharacterized protein (DUF362 family)/Pyruvate/2-oxoacid:ferredoxin oxidoreductase delta subunit